MNSTSPEFVSLTLDQVKPSSRNPRKTFDELNQLAASIKEKGVLVPILVRPRTLWQRVCGYVMGQKRVLDQDGSGYGISKPQFERAGISFKNVKQFDAIAKQLVEEGRAEIDHAGAATFLPGPHALDPVTDKDPLGLGIDHYQLVAGERRWRASAIAGVETIPALVRDLDDHAAAEIAVIENDQREDVAPLEQADGYARLIELGDDVETIAAKIGRPAKYVTARLTLTKLIPSLQEDLRSGKLPFGHAHLLARLPAAEQEAILDDDQFNLYEEHTYPTKRVEVMPLDELRQSIRECTKNLSAAPWKWDDETLAPAAGSCTKCPKRSGANPTLFDEIAHDPDAKKKSEICTDRGCFNAKQAAFVELQVKKAETKVGGDVLRISTEYHHRDGKGVLAAGRYEEVPAKDAGKKNVQAAVVVNGDGLGKLVHVKVKAPPKSATEDMERQRDKWAEEDAKRKQAEALGAIAMDRAAAVAAEAIKKAYAAAKPAKLNDMLRQIIAAWHIGTRGTERMLDRRGVKLKKNASISLALIGHIATLDTTEDLLAILAELTALDACPWDNWWSAQNRDKDPHRVDCRGVFGIDKAKLMKEAAAAAEKQAAEQPATEAPAKPAKKKQKAGAA